MKKRPQPHRASRRRRPSKPRAVRAERAHDPAPRTGERLALPLECTLAGAEDLKLNLAGHMHREEEITLDVSRVRRIDSASMQLIAVFVRDRRSREHPVHVGGESSAFAEASRLLGLDALLGASSPLPSGEG